MKESQYSILQLRRNVLDTKFYDRYKNLLLTGTKNLDDDEIRHLLKLGVIFLNFGDRSLQKLGYRIILRYSISHSDYKPLFDVAINKGFIPISKQIEERYSQVNSEGFFTNYFSAYQDNFKLDGIYLSYGQKRLIHLTNTTKNNVVVTAPTSYGKSEIIIRKIVENLDAKICVIVPSKALLSQTKRRILNSAVASKVGRIVTHSEMYKGNETSFVAVLTQERLLRLLEKNPALKFDLILVDEAHNLFKRDNRAILLAQVIMIIKKRNSDTVLNFFSPFISDHKRLRIPRSDYYLDGITSDETLKIERYYYCDFQNEKIIYLYDQFLNEEIKYSRRLYKDDIELIYRHSAEKNIIYLNKQRDIQNFAMRLANDLRSEPNVQISDELITAISDFLHPEYNLLKCLRAGVVYHHGGMPEIIRLYVESIYSKYMELKYIVTSSTLLEGVNIPAERIFLLTTKIGRRNFTKSEFKNLIGRICRFSEIFDVQNGSLNMLEPQVFLLKSGFEHANANHLKFLKENAKIDLKLTDDVDNILLKDEEELDAKEKSDLQDKLEYLENIEPNTVELDGVEYAQSDIAKLCYRNNVYDFDIKLNEDVLNRNLEDLELDGEITEPLQLMQAISAIFLENIVGIDVNNIALLRLKNLSAQKFYALVLKWRASGTSYSEMIANFMAYWKDLKDKVVYFGRAWGEVKRNDDDFLAAYIDLRTKNNSDRINLAIIKIKEEQDFFEFNLLKYIEIINELGLLNRTFYERIKYGSADSRVISLLKNGFSIELAKIVVEYFNEFIEIDVETDDITIRSEIIMAMEKAEVNKILIFEMNYHIKSSS